MTPPAAAPVSEKASPKTPARGASCALRCGRCGARFETRDCHKLDHFDIYRAVCPHCAWPGRYLANELRALHPASARAAAGRARSAN